VPEGSLLVAWNSIELWIGLVFSAPKFPLCDGFGWVGLKKLDPRTTPSHTEAIAWVVASFDK